MVMMLDLTIEKKWVLYIGYCFSVLRSATIGYIENNIEFSMSIHHQIPHCWNRIKIIAEYTLQADVSKFCTETKDMKQWQEYPEDTLKVLKIF